MEEKLTIKSLYLHFPFCRHLCNYCDFYKNIRSNDSQGDEDVRNFEQLLSSMFCEHEKLIKKEGYSWGELDSVYMGGGTPSLWGVDGANFLKDHFEKYAIKLSQNVEFTLEVNPGSWSAESLEAFKGIGVNRYSLGIQSLNPTFIKLLDRVHNVDDVYETLEYFSKNKANFSVDFMLGLPYSKEYKRDIISELEEILSYKPEHISLYILTVKDHYIHHKALPDEDWIESEFLQVAKYLKENGFNHYEVSNFSKPGKESFHNLEYWKMNTVAAIGPSGTGFLAGKNIRYKWKVKSPEYKVEELTKSEAFLEKVYMGLRIDRGVKFSIITDLEERNEFKNIAASWEKRNLAKVDKSGVALTSAGFLILDSLLDELFIKLKRSFE